MFSKRLTRQIKKVVGEEFLEKIPLLADFTCSASNTTEQATMSHLIKALPELFKTIDESYQQIEEKAQLASRSLELSSLELTESNFRLIKMNASFEAMLNCLGQGFVIFERNGLCNQVCSTVCEELLETAPAGKNIVDVLKIPEARKKTIFDWIELLFEETIDFEDLVQIGPRTYPHSKGRTIEIDFKPVRNSRNQIDAIVLIATDKTETVRAQEQVTRTMEHANLIGCILRDKNQFISFLRYARLTIDDLSAQANSIELLPHMIEDIKFRLHNLKGTAGSFGFNSLQKVVHDTETSLIEARDERGLQKIISQNIKKIFECYEGTLLENKVLFDRVLSYSGPIRELTLKSLLEFHRNLAKLNDRDVADKFAENFIELPADQVFQRYITVLDEACTKLAKRRPSFKICSAGIRLVPERFDSILNLLVHVFRNIAVHAIEPDEERKRHNKPIIAEVLVKVRLASLKSQDTLLIEIADDGRGLDLEKIRCKLKDLGRREDAETFSDAKLFEVVFEPGFSTAQNLNEYGGRGIGLSALQAEVNAIGGKIALLSVTGQGMKITISIPYNKICGIQKNRSAAI